MTGSAESRSAPFALLVCGILSVSVSGLIARRALAEATPLMLSAWRMGGAAVFFLCVRFLTPGPAELTQTLLPRERTRLVAGGAVLAIHFLFWFASLTMTTVSIATLLVCTTPLWTALGQIALRRQAAGVKFWCAFAAALAGIILVARPFAAQGAITPRQELGDVFALAGGLFYAIYLLAVDGLQHHSSACIVTWTYSVAAIVLWVVAAAVGHPTLTYSASVWGAIALATVVPQIIGHTLINHVLNFFQAHVVAFSILAEPVIASSLAVVLLHEVVTPVMIVGGALVLTALAVALATSSRKATVEDVGEL